MLRDGQVDRHARLLLDRVPWRSARPGSTRCGSIGQLASDKFSKLAKQGELTRIKQMVENAPVNMMYADLDMKIQYMNPQAVTDAQEAGAHLPIKVDQMIGQTIDIFHKQPEHQRRLLADPRNLPRTATIRVGPEFFELSVSAMVDQNGQYIGPMITWEVVTEKLEAKAREASWPPTPRRSTSCSWPWAGPGRSAT